MIPTFRLKTLGELRLVGPNGVVRELRRRERALLARIARCGPVPIRRAELTALLWGERDDARAKHALRQALFALRRVLGEALEVGTQSVRLLPGAVELDVAVLEHELGAGDAAAAFDLWTGTFLDGMEDDADDTFRLWIESERAALRRLLDSALELLRVAAQADGAWDEVVLRTRRFADAHPWDESAQRRLVETLRDAGRTQEAATTQLQFSARLRSELGIEPSASFAALATELKSASERPAFDGHAGIATPVLVGRATVCGLALRAWGEVAHGASRFLLVEGVEGSGRSRYCDELVGAIRRDCPACVVLRARRLATPDINPWSSAARLFASLRNAPGLSGVDNEVLAELAVIVPSIRERFAGLPLASGGPEELHSAIERVLADVAAEIPILILADDFPEFDPATRTSIGRLARQLPAHVMLLATSSPASLRTDPDLRRLLRARDAAHVVLRSLRKDELSALVASMIDLPTAARGALAQRILEEVGGEPLAAVEVIAALADQGTLIADSAGGPWRLSASFEHDGLPLPPRVQHALKHRLGQLPANERDVISAAAVLGRAAEPQLLGALTGLSPAAVDAALVELNAHGILAGGEFVHASMRRTAESMLGQGNRVRLHSVAATTLRRGARDRADRARVRYHSERAGPRGSRLIATTAILLAGLSIVLLTRLNGTSSVPVLAVANMSGHGLGPDDPALASLPEVISTELSRVAGLRVVSRNRMRELAARSSDSRAAAQAGGIDELLEGELSADSAGYTIAMRRVDVRTGRVRMEYKAESRDALELGRRIASAVSTSLEFQLPAASGTAPGFIAARALYEEGLKAFHLHRDYHSALRLFTAALAQDSGFAMAAFHEARSAQMLMVSPATVAPRLARAAALAENAPERDRLLIRAFVAQSFNDPFAVVAAESLASRYPHEPWGAFLAGNALIESGRFTDGVVRLRQVIALEPIPENPALPCTACDAYSSMAFAYWHADSLPASVRVMREWISRQPQNPAAWMQFAGALESTERFAEADGALRRASQLGSGSGTTVLWEAMRAIRRVDFARADVALDYLSRVSDNGVAQEAVWYQVISYRNQGRYREAERAAQRYRELTLVRAAPRHPYATPQAVVFLEAGSPQRAAALFDTMFHSVGDLGHASRTGRDQAWLLTLRASALAAAGDTFSLQGLADSIRIIGSRSSYGRDPRLHHHVRGVLARARGDLPGAEAELSAAMFSTVAGYTRTNLELARVHMARGNAAQAIPLLQAALRAPLDGAALYVTRSEVHENLAHAFESVGQADSAAAHYRALIASWARADSRFAARVADGKHRLAALGRGRSVASDGIR